MNADIYKDRAERACALITKRPGNLADSTFTVSISVGVQSVETRGLSMPDIVAWAERVTRETYPGAMFIYDKALLDLV